jgi:glycosyltransferase involved in cell wall biosynthesis
MSADNKPLLSIVTVVYNGERYITDTLESVVSQKHPLIEHIVIDGGSTDNTVAICSEYSSSIDIMISEPDNGIYDAMNKGLHIASGEYVSYLNADDYLVPDILAKIFKAISETSPDYLYCNLDYIDDAHTVKRRWVSGKYDSKNLKSLWIPPHPSSFIRTQLLRDLGGFNVKYKLAADYDLMLRAILSANTVEYLDGVAVKMRLGGATNKSWKNIIYQNVEIFRSYHAIYKTYPIASLMYKLLNRLKQQNRSKIIG